MVTTLKLKIKPDEFAREYWETHPTYNNAKINEDCGLDIPFGKTIIVPAKAKAFTLNLGYSAEQNFGYQLVPRSSISKTPLRLANSIGIIDKSYRGTVMAKVDNISNEDFTIEVGKCFFQIIAFNGILPEFELVNEINETLRGSGGFGSTQEVINN